MKSAISLNPVIRPSSCTFRRVEFLNGSNAAMLHYYPGRADKEGEIPHSHYICIDFIGRHYILLFNVLDSLLRCSKPRTPYSVYCAMIMMIISEHVDLRSSQIVNHD